MLKCRYDIMPGAEGLILTEDGYCVRVISEDARLREAYVLRHRVFCEELGWVEGTAAGLEVDTYDKVSVSFGVYDSGGKLLAYLRLTPPGNRFMLDSEFAHLVGPGHRISKGPDRAEVSRLCVSPEARDGLASCRSARACVLSVLFKGVYHWCVEHGIRFLYAVVEEKARRLYRMRGLPLRDISGQRLTLKDHAARAVKLDWKEFEERARKDAPGLLGWFQSGPTGTGR